MSRGLRNPTRFEPVVSKTVAKWAFYAAALALLALGAFLFRMNILSRPGCLADEDAVQWRGTGAFLLVCVASVSWISGFLIGKEVSE